MKISLILLDEVSMVGNSMFNVQINNQLKDIKGSKADFGGVSIIAIGDLFQLKPVTRFAPHYRYNKRLSLVSHYTHINRPGRSTIPTGETRILAE